ncbi:MAG: DUF4168 domain-containing protein [Elainellaceae cyanobacterium]
MVYFILCQILSQFAQRVRHWARSVRAMMHTGIILVAVVGFFVPAFPSRAEQLPPTEPESSAEEMAPNRPELDADDISSEKVSQFVQAYLEVMALIEQREGELSGAETESESIRIQRDIEADAFSVIEQAGLTWQEYIQLLGLANSDPEFGERIAAQLEEAIGG